MSPHIDLSSGRGPRAEATGDQFRLLVEGTTEYAIFMLSPDGRVLSWNEGARRTKGYVADEIIGRHFSIFYLPEDVESGHPDWELDVAQRDGRYEEQGWRLRKDGSRFWAQVTITALRDERGDLRGYGKVTRDLTDRHAAERALQEAHARFAALVAHSSDVICILDADGLLTYASPAYKTIYGEDPLRREGSSILRRIRPADRARFTESIDRVIKDPSHVVTFDCEIVHPDGTNRSIEVTAANRLDDPAIEGIVTNSRDVTERVQAARRLAHEAMHDALTGLPNRALLVDRANQALRRAERSDRAIAVFFIDLDHFKRINDSLGHAAGDTLLVNVATRLRQVLRPGDTAARLGGDEFVVLAEDIPDDGAAHQLAERIRQAIYEPMPLVDREVTVGCSVGITVARTGRPEAILQEADTALYRAKARGRGRWEIYNQAMRLGAQQRLDAEFAIRSALDHDRVAVHYQPIISLASGACVASEALVRLKTLSGGIVAPDTFIPAAEESGLIVPLGLAVLDIAAGQLAEWTRHGTGPARMAVNLSPRQLLSPTLVSDVSRIIDAHGLDPATLCLELTETALMEADSSSRGAVRELTDLGVAVALDDFGTGMSSLSHLRTFPISAVKIDRSFVAGLDVNRDDDAVVRSVIGLGVGLGIGVIAEGVETARQAEILVELGCTEAQGFLFGRPTPA